jgi:hypothetical protein
MHGKSELRNCSKIPTIIADICAKMYVAVKCIIWMQYFVNVRLVKCGDACSNEDYTSWPSTTETVVNVE